LPRSVWGCEKEARRTHPEEVVGEQPIEGNGVSTAFGLDSPPTEIEHIAVDVGLAPAPLRSFALCE
jgi:hypothetical protein